MKNFRLACVLQALVSSQLLFAGPPNGHVVWWGDNSGGETSGAHQSGYSTGIVTVASGILSNAVAVSASSFFNLALRTDGTVIGWGWNANGQAIGSETPGVDHTNGLVSIGNQVLSNVTAIAADGFSLALKKDGTVVGWGQSKVPVGLTNIAAIAARGFFSVVLKSNGTVVSWGSAPWIQTEVPVGLSNVVAITCGGGQYERSMALKKDGTVVVWKSSMPHGEEVPTGVTNVVAIAAGVCHSLALKKDGTVFGWGCNTDGQATGIPQNNPPDVSSFQNGLVTIGGQVLSNVVAIAAGNEYNLALKKDGTVVAWGNKRFYRDVPAGLSGVVAIAAGENFCLAITTNVLSR